MLEPVVFPRDEYDRRLANVRERLEARGLRGLLVSAPENVYYLTGLEHQGYFAYEALVVSVEREPVLVTRAMEAATVRDQVPWIDHLGYSDGVAPLPRATSAEEDIVFAERSDDGEVYGLRPWEMSAGVAVLGPVATDSSVPVAKTTEALRSAGLDSGPVGIEKRSSFLPNGIAEGVAEELSDVEWTDASDLVDECRLVQSPLELECTRRAAVVTEAMMLSAIAAAGPDVPERDVMAACYDAMFRRGGTYPGFVPLVRSTRTLEHEHGTWTDGVLQSGDLLFVELAGCVRRYHAPAGRLVFIGEAQPHADTIQKVCEEAMMSAAEVIAPGVTADAVYRSWQSVVDANGLEGYSRHHCGYAVGIGFPPSWSGSGTPRGLRRDSSMELEEGMVFHLMSWLLRTGRGDSFLSDTVVVTDSGCEFLTDVSRAVTTR